MVQARHVQAAISQATGAHTPQGVHGLEGAPQGVFEESLEESAQGCLREPCEGSQDGGGHAPRHR
jgi:hypothetical protein